MGRSKLYASDAERQRAYRVTTKGRSCSCLPLPQIGAILWHSATLRQGTGQTGVGVPPETATATAIS